MITSTQLEDGTYFFDLGKPDMRVLGLPVYWVTDIAFFTHPEVRSILLDLGIFKVGTDWTRLVHWYAPWWCCFALWLWLNPIQNAYWWFLRYPLYKWLKLIEPEEAVMFSWRRHFKPARWLLGED